LLLVTGRASEGVSEQRSAVLLNPLDHGLSCSLTRKLYAARRYDEAIDHGHQAARDFPSCAYDPLFVAEALIAETRASEAIDLLNASLELEVTARALARLGVALSREGRPEDARATLQRLRAASDYDPYFAALLLTELGDTDAAFASLDEAFRQRSPHLVWLHAEPGFDSLREDPRFDNLRTRVGLWRS
jgi:tetratricopeptide (TPR) repeat protein